MTSNDSTTTPKGTHMNTPHPGKRTAPTRIPVSIKSIEIERSPYPGTPKPLYVTLKGDTWMMRFDTTDDELLARINEIADAMEAVK